MFEYLESEVYLAKCDKCGREHKFNCDSYARAVEVAKNGYALYNEKCIRDKCVCKECLKVIFDNRGGKK